MGRDTPAQSLLGCGSLEGNRLAIHAGRNDVRWTDVGAMLWTASSSSSSALQIRVRIGLPDRLGARASTFCAQTQMRIAMNSVWTRITVSRADGARPDHLRTTICARNYGRTAVARAQTEHSNNFVWATSSSCCARLRVWLCNAAMLYATMCDRAHNVGTPALYRFLFRAERRKSCFMLQFEQIYCVYSAIDNLTRALFHDETEASNESCSVAWSNNHEALCGCVCVCVIYINMFIEMGSDRTLPRPGLSTTQIYDACV